MSNSKLELNQHYSIYFRTVMKSGKTLFQGQKIKDINPASFEHAKHFC